MAETNDNKFVLAGDIGGTKTNLGLFSKTQGPLIPEAFEVFSSARQPDLPHMLRQFYERHPGQLTQACFGVAGPVVNGVAKTTNCPGMSRKRLIKKAFGLKRVRLVNDVAATAMAITLLPQD